MVRIILGAASWGALGIALWTKDLRWAAASCGFGTFWWFSDFFGSRIFRPFGGLVLQVFRGGPGRPVLDQRTIHDAMSELEIQVLDQATSREVQIQAALRLSDLYRVINQDEVRAEAVMNLVRGRFPDAVELTKIPRMHADKHGSAPDKP